MDNTEVSVSLEVSTREQVAPLVEFVGQLMEKMKHEYNWECTRVDLKIVD